MPLLPGHAVAVAAFLTGFFPTISIAAANAAAGMFLLAVAVAHLRGSEQFSLRPTPFDKPLLFFLGAWLLSSALGLDPARSFGKAGAQFRFVLFYLAAGAGDGRHRPVLLKGFLWGAGVSTAYGLLQGAAAWLEMPETFPELFLTLDRGMSRYASLVMGRVHGAVHPLTYAELILPFFLLGAAWTMEGAGARDVLKKSLWPTAAGAALLLSQSRGPWLAAGAGLMVLMVHPSRRKLAPLLLLAAVAVAAAPALKGRATSIVGGPKDESTSHRMILWNNAFQAAARNPATGVGTGNLEKAVKKHSGEPGFLPNPRGRDGDAHNQYLQHLAERGVVGLLALLWVLGTPILMSARGIRSSAEDFPPRWVRWGMLAYFCAFLVVNLTERVFDDAEPVMVFWLLAAMLPRGDQRR